MKRLTDDELKELQEKARKARIRIIKMIGGAGSGHPGGSLSCVEILTALYFKIMRHEPKNPEWEDRDRFILSKGHAAPALYATLAEAGYFDEEILYTLRKLGSNLQGHPSRNLKMGIETSTGSLGQGLAQACGVSLAGKIDGKDYYVYALIGDGECNEGCIWESAMFAVHNSLDNLIVFLDRNMLQLDGRTEDILKLEPLEKKWEGFGWHTQRIDGHDFNQIVDAVENAKRVKGVPSMIICDTVKGKGVSFMEGVVSFHGKAPTEEQVEIALRELEE